MRVITSNPIIVNGKKESTNDMYIGVNGQVIPYQVGSTIGPVYDTLDRDDFYPAEGCSNAYGSRRKKRDEMKDRKMKLREQRVGSKADARTTRSDAKKEEAFAKQKMADSLATSTQGDVALANALAKTGGSKKEKGLSTGAKIGIAVGVLALLGFGTYMIMKNKKLKTT